MMTQEAFDILDDAYNGLIPEQDLGDGTYEWVCDYAGGKFYQEIITDEQEEEFINNWGEQWLNSGN